MSQIPSSERTYTSLLCAPSPSTLEMKPKEEVLNSEKNKFVIITDTEAKAVQLLEIIREMRQFERVYTSEAKSRKDLLMSHEMSDFVLITKAEIRASQRLDNFHEWRKFERVRKSEAQAYKALYVEPEKNDFEIVDNV